MNILFTQFIKDNIRKLPPSPAHHATEALRHRANKGRSSGGRDPHQAEYYLHVLLLAPPQSQSTGTTSSVLPPRLMARHEGATKITLHEFWHHIRDDSEHFYHQAAPSA